MANQIIDFSEEAPSFENLLAQKEALMHNAQNILRAPNTNKLATAQGHANLYDFINLVGILCKKVFKDEVEFCPDEGARILLDATSSLNKPRIQFSIIERIPDKQLKPKIIEQKFEQDDKGNKHRAYSIYSQFFRAQIQFDILASDYITANQVMYRLEEMLFNYSGWIKNKGVSEIIFQKQFTDRNLDLYRDNVSVRSLQYLLRIEQLRKVYDTILTDIAIDDVTSR